MSMARDPLNVIIAGVGGQGNVLASQMLGWILVSKGYVVTIGETYGASQRGGAVMSHLRISETDQFSPIIPEGKCHLLVSLEPVEGLRIIEHYGNPEIKCLLNIRPIHPLNVISGETTYPEISRVLMKVFELSQHVWTLNATEIALKVGDPICTNMVMLGALANLELITFNRLEFRAATEALLPGARLSVNLEAFDKGGKEVQEFIR
jgi:indolepyruvate ferredoxin oxidoreductase beta subunit